VSVLLLYFHYEPISCVLLLSQDVPILASLKTGLFIDYRDSVAPTKPARLQNLSNRNFLPVLNEAPHHEDIWGIEAYLRTFFLALEGGVLSSRPVVLLRWKSTRTDWLGSRESLDVLEKRKISCPCLVKPVA
jgi:hypothetical protein